MAWKSELRSTLETVRGAIGSAIRVGQIANHVGTPLIVAALLLGIAAATLREAIPDYIERSQAPDKYLAQLMATEMLPLRQDRYPVIAAAEIANRGTSVGPECNESSTLQICREVLSLHTAFKAASEPVNEQGLVTWIESKRSSIELVDLRREIKNDARTAAERAARQLRQVFHQPATDDPLFWKKWKERLVWRLTNSRPSLENCSPLHASNAVRESFIKHEKQFGPAGCLDKDMGRNYTSLLIPSILNNGWSDKLVKTDCKPHVENPNIEKCYSWRVLAAIEISEILEPIAQVLEGQREARASRTDVVAAYFVTPDGIIREWAENNRSVYDEVGPAFLWNYGDYFRRFLRNPKLENSSPTVPYFDFSGNGLIRTLCTPIYIKDDRANVGPIATEKRRVLAGSFCTDYRLTMSTKHPEEESPVKKALPSDGRAKPSSQIYKSIEVPYITNEKGSVIDIKVGEKELRAFFEGIPYGHTDYLELLRSQIQDANLTPGSGGELRPIKIRDTPVFLIPHERHVVEGREEWKSRLVRPVVLQAPLEPFVIPVGSIAIAFVFVFWAAASARAKSLLHREEAILRNLQVAVYAAAPSKTCEGANDRAEELFGRKLPTLGVSPSLRDAAVDFSELTDKLIAVEKSDGSYYLVDQAIVQKWRENGTGPEYYFSRRSISVWTSDSHDTRWLRIRGTRFLGGAHRTNDRTRSFCIALPVSVEIGKKLEGQRDELLAREA